MYVNPVRILFLLVLCVQQVEYVKVVSRDTSSMPHSIVNSALPLLHSVAVSYAIPLPSVSIV